MSTLSSSIQKAHSRVVFSKIHSEGSLRVNRGLVVDFPVLSKFDSLRAISAVRMQLHPLTLCVVFVISCFTWKTCSKHLDVHISTFSRMTALDSVFIQQPSTLHHPWSRVATIGHYVEISPPEALCVQAIYILKLHIPVFKNPVTSTFLSMSSVPDEHCTSNNDKQYC